MACSKFLSLHSNACGNCSSVGLVWQSTGGRTDREHESPVSTTLLYWAAQDSIQSPKMDRSTYLSFPPPFWVGQLDGIVTGIIPFSHLRQWSYRIACGIAISCQPFATDKPHLVWLTTKPYHSYKFSVINLPFYTWKELTQEHNSPCII